MFRVVVALHMNTCQWQPNRVELDAYGIDEFLAE